MCNKKNVKACHKTYEFTCADGTCISKLDVCNSFDDCSDRSDEFNCTRSVDNYESEKIKKKPDEVAKNRNRNKVNKDDPVESDPMIIDTTDDDDVSKVAELIDQLDKLERQHLANPNRVIQKTPKEFLDSLMIESKDSTKYRPPSNNNNNRAQQKSTKSAVIFHGI